MVCKAAPAPKIYTLLSINNWPAAPSVIVAMPPVPVCKRVTVPPDARTLRAVAKSTGGRFYGVADAARLKEVYADLGSRLGHRQSRTEITSAFAGGGTLLLLLASGLSMLWTRRPL